MKQFSFDLQRFAATVTGHIIKSASGSTLSGNTLSFRDSDSFTIQEPKTLNNSSWAEISAIAQAGRGAEYFHIGDCKEITLNGNIGEALELTNEKLYVYILHFNYPINDTPDNNIIFGGFKTVDGTDVALCDTHYMYGSQTGSVGFNMNHSGNTTYGGWKGCDLRYDILGATSTAPSDYGIKHTETCVGYNATTVTLTSPKEDTLLAALPSDFRNVLKLWSRWIDAKGNGSNTEEGIEETIDAVTLLTEFEIYGERTWANQYEQNYQRQMDYYKNNNSKIKYRHSSTSSAVNWLLSSTFYDSSSCCWINDNGSIARSGSYISVGIAPAFKV